MNLILSFTCILLLMFSLNQNSAAIPLLTAKKAFDGALAVYSAIEKVHKNLKSGQPDMAKIVSIQEQINNKLDYLAEDVQNVKDKILSKMTNQLRDKLTEKTDELFDYIHSIDLSYKTFYRMVRNKTTFTNSQKKNFATISTSYSLVELPSVINKMHKALVDLDVKRESIITIIGQSFAYETMCIRGQSPQQLIYELYKIVVDADTKGLLVKLYSYDLLQKLENDNEYQSIKRSEKNLHFSRLKSTYKEVKRVMRTASREVWKCDPKIHKKDVTYTKLQEIFQGFFMYEADTTLNRQGLFFDLSRTLANMAMYECKDLKLERYRCNSDVCKAQPEERRCTGKIRDCQFISNEMQVCHAPQGSDRRYDWMHVEGTENYYGNYYSDCENTQGMNGITPIDMCFCNCESETQDASRYFSLLASVSDTEENKVITGIRLTKDKHVFHIQIQQGKLGENGNIVGEVEWKKINEIGPKLLLSKKVSSHKHIRISETRYEDWTEFYENNFVFTVTYDQNTVYLDDYDSQNGELLTGLRFKQVDKNLRLEFQTTPYDYATGQLNVAASSWHYNNNNTYQRQEVSLQQPGDPVKSIESDVFSRTNQFIRFGMSGIENDLGQNTVPFLDIQNVVTKSESPLPLSGAGIFHKHDNKNGGFLAIKLIHYDFTQNMPEEKNH